MQVLFVAGFGPIVRDLEASHRLYVDTLGLQFVAEDGDYLHTEALDGAKTFALWPLSHVAESCFGTADWPAHLPVPQAWLEFEVDDVAAASSELTAKGYTLLISTKLEPWGQTVTRLLSPEGVVMEVTHTPALHESD